MYMFWAITTGITTGASMYILAVLASVIMIVIILIFSKNTGRRKAYIVVVNYEGDEAGDEILRTLGKLKYSVRSKILREDNVEMTLQVNCKMDNLVFAERMRLLKGVKDVTLLEFNGEYHG